MSYRSAFCLWVTVVLTVATLAGCKSGLLPSGGIPGVDSEKFAEKALPDRAIDTLAASFYTWHINKAKEAGRTVTECDPKNLEEPVAQVLNAVIEAAKQSPEYGKAAKEFKWECHVIEDNLINAFAWPGGKIAVSTGLLSYAENAAGLAMLLGHESVHALDRHVRDRIDKTVLAALPIGALAAGTALNPDDLKPEVVAPILAALGGVGVAADRAFSRERELQADDDGMVLAAQAGFDPEHAVRFWARIPEHQEEGYFKSHPSDTKRYKMLTDQMDKYRAVYQQAQVKQDSLALLRTSS